MTARPNWNFNWHGQNFIFLCMETYKNTSERDASGPGGWKSPGWSRKNWIMASLTPLLVIDSWVHVVWPISTSWSEFSAQNMGKSLSSLLSKILLPKKPFVLGQLPKNKTKQQLKILRSNMLKSQNWTVDFVFCYFVLSDFKGFLYQ